MSRLLTSLFISPLSVAIAVLSALSAACGEDSPAAPAPQAQVDAAVPPGTASCESLASTYKACGGDVLGEWKVKGVCTDLGASVADAKTSCPDGVLESFASGRGTYTFTADGQAVPKDVFIGNLVHLDIPKVCNERTCEDLAASLPGEEGDQASCNDTGTTCDCKLLSKETQITKADPYTIDGTNITISTTATYCVTDKQLVIALPTSQTNPTATFLVFER